VTAPQKTPDKPLTPRHAWQPFTPRGVAAFGVATLTRVVLAQCAVAGAVAIALVWFLRLAWVPVVNEAIQRLPDAGFIRRGELNYSGESPQRLAENPHLAVVVDLAGSRAVGHVADVEATFEKRRVIFRGPLGKWEREYDRGYIISFNRPELEPWWGAWCWAVLAVVALAMVLSLFLMWWSLALVYVPLVKFIAFFADRAVTWRGAWRLSAAALLPGACLVALALLLYGFGAIPLFQFGLLYALHLVVGLVFVLAGPFFLPKLSEARTMENPFGRAGEAKPSNPFDRPDLS
jgi:hypothetical protein